MNAVEKEQLKGKFRSILRYQSSQTFTIEGLVDGNKQVQVL